MNSRIMVFLKQNMSIRYLIYIIGLVLMLLPFFGVRGYIADNDSWSKGLQAFFGACGYFSFSLGLSMLVMPALLGRAEFIKFFFGGDIWTLFRSMAYGLYMFSPCYSLLYFLSMSIDQHLDYQMMFYNFSGIFVFSLILTCLFFTFVDRPFHAMFNISHDLERVTTEMTLTPLTQFNIEDYKLKTSGDYDEPLMDGGEKKLLRDPFSSNANGVRGQEKSTFDVTGNHSPLSRRS